MHAFALARKAGIELDTVESAVVQGLGPVGLYSLLYLKALGIRRVFAITSGRNEARERIAREFGAERVFALSSQAAEEINAEILRETGGLGVDLAIEASGAPSAFAEGLDLLRNRGVYLVPGQYSSSGTVAIHPESITFKALHIIGSSQYSFGDVRAYLAFLENIRKQCTKHLADKICELQNFVAKYSICDARTKLILPDLFGL